MEAGAVIRIYLTKGERLGLPAAWMRFTYHGRQNN
jgi:hypothetical protein